MTFLKTTLLIFSLTLLSCSSTKSQGNTTTSTEIETATTDKMIEQGYKKATVVASTKEGDCPYTLKMDGENDNYYDPINLEENFKVDGLKVWLTFGGLRMMNRCEKANPISIIDIQKRDK